MYSTLDRTCYVQILDGGVTSTAERGNSSIVTTVDNDIQRMAVTIKRTSIRSVFIHTNRLGDSDVCLQAGINPILTLGLFHFIAELVPVVCSSDVIKRDFCSRGFLNP